MGPTNEKETADYQYLLEAMSGASSAVGWAIATGRALEEGQQFQNGLLEMVRSKLTGVDSRLCIGYSTLFFCIQKVGWFLCRCNAYHYYFIA